MTDETTTEIRLVREHGAVGGWRVERKEKEEEMVAATVGRRRRRLEPH